MKDTVASFELAKIAKERGFDWATVYAYQDMISAPTLSLLQKWIREVLKKHIVIICHSEDEWIYHSSRLGDNPEKLRASTYSTYEKALEAGLLKTLKTHCKNQL